MPDLSIKDWRKQAKSKEKPEQIMDVD